MRKTLTLSLATLLVAAVAVAQSDKKPLSPPAKAEAKLNGKNVTIDYSAPSKRGREIMGGLVPYSKVWRTGANAATSLKTETDLMIGNLHVPAGSYTLYTIPNANDWTLIVNKQTGQWGTNYDLAQDLGRVRMKVAKVKDSVETFNIALEPAKDAKSATLTMTWENTQASVPVTVH